MRSLLFFPLSSLLSLRGWRGGHGGMVGESSINEVGARGPTDHPLLRPQRAGCQHDQHLHTDGG